MSKRSLKQSHPRVAIIGGGLGGPSAAALLHRAGFEVKVYEQAAGFSRIGAGIHLSPNVVRVLQRIGIGQRLIETGVRPPAWVSREWDSGEILLDHTLGEEAEARFGAPYLIVHRGDFHALLIEALPAGAIEFGKRLVDLDASGDAARLGFADGSKAEADIVIGADGVRSRVRELLVGLDQPIYTGHVAHRSIFPRSLLGDLELEDCSKWWGKKSSIMLYFITSSRREMYFVSSSPQAEWPHDTASVPADLEALGAAFEGFHPTVRKVLDACPEASKWAMFDCAPLPLWSRGRIVLLGDACHAMTPYMGQGAAMAIEDAAMLARCLEQSPADFDRAFRLYEANRKTRTARMQQTSRMNTWLRDDGDADWVFGYNVFTEPLVAPGPAANAA
jgi:6-hydroxynicotinate 3-monooxygenase